MFPSAIRREQVVVHPHRVQARSKLWSAKPNSCAVMIAATVAPHLVCVRPHGRREGAGQAEVGDLERQGGRVDEQVGGLEVPVQHPPRVQVLDALHQLPHQPLRHTAAVSALGAMSTRKDGEQATMASARHALWYIIATMRLHCHDVRPCSASGVRCSVHDAA